jgi:hypothetical protein
VCGHLQAPFRSYQRDIIRTEPLIYRLEEAVLHYGPGEPRGGLTQAAVCGGVCVVIMKNHDGGVRCDHARDDEG